MAWIFKPTLEMSQNNSAPNCAQLGETHICLPDQRSESFIMFPIRYKACSYRDVEERLPHGSTLRLNDPLQHCGVNRLDSHSRHGSLQRLESQSRHSSMRDLTITAQAIQSSPGNGIHRVKEEDATKAWTFTWQEIETKWVKRTWTLLAQTNHDGWHKYKCSNYSVPCVSWELNPWPYRC